MHCIGIITMLSGTICFVGRGTDPKDLALEDHAQHAFKTLGVETHERLPKEALLNYYNIRIIELCESKGMDVCDTPMIFLLCYDLVSMSMLEDAPATTTVVLNSEEIGFD